MLWHDTAVIFRTRLNISLETYLSVCTQHFLVKQSIFSYAPFQKQS